MFETHASRAPHHEAERFPSTARRYKTHFAKVGYKPARERLCCAPRAGGRFTRRSGNTAGSTWPPRRSQVLNRYDRPSPMAGEAEVKYLDGDFRVIRPGAFVRCAVTGIPIPLEELKYWSVDLQEAYASPEAVLQRHFPVSD